MTDGVRFGEENLRRAQKLARQIARDVKVIVAAIKDPDLRRRLRDELDGERRRGTED